MRKKKDEENKDVSVRKELLIDCWKEGGRRNVKEE